MNPRPRQPHSPFLRILTALGLGIAAAFALLLLVNTGYSLAFSGEVMPGVTMNGVSLSGYSIDEATALIASAPQYPENGRVLLTDGQKNWTVRPVELGFFLDAQASAQSAYKVGRQGSLFSRVAQRAWMLKHDIPIQPVLLFNQPVGVNFLNTLGSQINQPLREASLALSGTEVQVVNGQSGRALDVASSLAAVAVQVQTMQDGVVPLHVLEAQPLILDATLPAELARGILSQSFKLTLPAGLNSEDGPWRIQPEELATMLTFERVSNGSGAEIRVIINEPVMNAYLQTLRAETEVAPLNARFIFNDETGQLDLLEHAVIGRELNIEESVNAINQAVVSGAHEAVLVFDLNDPPVTDAKTGAELGITELVTAYTSYFRGSSPERVHNIETAAATFHGLLIPPGGVLSMSDVLGDISLDNGYAEALIILGDETITGVGGGVCQVSTTLFRTAFFAGFEILERHAHAYRVYYYEQNASGHDANLAGLDATVFVPLVDFKFRNDTDSWLLMETYPSRSNSSLTWKFYSTKDGRQVSYHSSGVTNIKKPLDPLYRENPELPKGTIDQVDWEVEGADVEVTRTVSLNGSILHSDRFFTRYEPWRDIFEYGPGTELPKEKQ